jgi:hypothetical protein
VPRLALHSGNRRAERCAQICCCPKYVSVVSSKDADQIGEMSEADRTRIRLLLEKIASGPELSSRPLSYLEVWITEHRMQAERRATARLALATWVLVAATAVLAFATIALVVATVTHSG